MDTKTPRASAAAVKAVAKDVPRGWFPRGFSGEQPYWTIVGLDGGTRQGLIGEDGAVDEYSTPERAAMMALAQDFGR